MPMHFSEAGLNWALIIRKKTTQKTITDKKMETTKYSESIGGSIWFRSKLPF